MMKRAILILSSVLLYVSSSWAATGGDVLRAPLSARIVAMGGAYAAVVKDIQALACNPAGLMHIQNMQVTLMHNIGIIDDTEYLAWGGPIKAGGSLGAGVLYRHLPDIDNTGDEDSALAVSDMVVIIGYARAFRADPNASANLGAGLNLKWLRSILGEYTATTMAVDFGVWWRPNAFKDFQLGLALQNLGGSLKYLEAEEALPLNFKLGTAYHLLKATPHQLTMTADVNIPRETEWLRAGVGAEYWFNNLIALRLGYQYQNESLASVVQGGVGVRYAAGNINIQLDYAFKPVVFSSETFDSEHFLSLTIGF